MAWIERAIPAGRTARSTLTVHTADIVTGRRALQRVLRRGRAATTIASAAVVVTAGGDVVFDLGVGSATGGMWLWRAGTNRSVARVSGTSERAWRVQQALVASAPFDVRPPTSDGCPRRPGAQVVATTGDVVVTRAANRVAADADLSVQWDYDTWRVCNRTTHHDPIFFQDYAAVGWDALSQVTLTELTPEQVTISVTRIERGGNPYPPSVKRSDTRTGEEIPVG